MMLDDADVFVELTVAGPSSGLHRYNFLGDKRRYLIFDPTHAVERVVNCTCSFLQNGLSTEACA